MSAAHIFVWELSGTAMLTLLGCGVGANVTLRRSLGYDGGWLLVTFGWGVAVFVGASIAAPSGAHINPAVTIGLAVNGQVPWSQVPCYLAGQMVGATIGAFVCWAAYKLQFDTHDDPDTTRSVFCTGPTVRNTPWNLVTETVATFVLVLWIILTPAARPGPEGIPDFGNSALGYAAVMFVVIGLGTSLGGPTGYAMNPARDLGPRVAYALLPVRGSADWSYSWIPVAGPIAGAVIAGLAAEALSAV
ncbi:MIP/aquaporin family protein [Streptomyces sp. S465]|uniref:MIP/aquaporin family protein n=1 Tax=Streptomyces sp. S465 TaxID=2979468 RepID=UPI0022A8CA7C|nr:MIP/aquaporin family protein [Streptomyces sp. S465]WAP58394.1 aquaporin family protein [Streptomyces sp. S465]